jgi:hypothetical protein
VATDPLTESRLFPLGQERFTSDDVWTPSWIFDRLGLTFDLDVATPPGGVEWIPAARYYTQAEDGLAQPWEGRVWMNPPYSNATPWVHRFINHAHGVALLPFARSHWLNLLWERADGIVIPPKVGSFVWADRESSIRLPVQLAAFGAECVDALHGFGVKIRVAA